MDRIAFVGLGAMGWRMAARLLEAGYELAVWNRSPGRTAELVERGARAGASPADAVRNADAVITMISDPSALRAVTEGPDGVAAGAGSSTTVIEMSTVGPDAVLRLQAHLDERTPLLDAPVLGSLAEAESGSLKIFVGGARSLFERWQPLLSMMGAPLHVGPLGAGAAAKLVANATLFGTIALLGEALALARALGIPQDKAFEVLSATPLAAQAERRRAAISSGTYPARFSLSLARKDADLIAAAAAARGVDMRLATAARAWITDADAAGLGTKDYAGLIAYILGAP